LWCSLSFTPISSNPRYIVFQCVAWCHSLYRLIYFILVRSIGWLRLVGSFKLYVSFAEYCLVYRALFQKRPITQTSLDVCMCMCVCTCGYVSALFTLSPYSSDLRYAHKHLRYTHKHHLMCVCMCVHVCVCKRVVQSIAILPEVHVFMNKWIYIYVYAYIYTYIYIYVVHSIASYLRCTYSWINVCIHVYIYICIYIYIYIVHSIAVLPEVHVFMNKYMHTHTCVRVHTSGRHSLYPCLAKGTHASPENTYMFVFVCVYVCVCVCVCVCVYVRAHNGMRSTLSTSDWKMNSKKKRDWFLFYL